MTCRETESREIHTSNVDVTIVMPCLNERRTLPKCIEMANEALDQLRQQGLDGEILISDNGSDDGSVEIAEQLGCRVVHCPRKGYGSALMHGCSAARGRFIAMGDADGSYDFREAVPMIARLREGYDLCMGNRFRGGIKKGAMPSAVSIEDARDSLALVFKEWASAKRKAV